ncbi:EbsA family protein [Periweissella beninensis]|uniref:Pore-forming protein n=1 Tax=Periweissella beninensis TaxID=504936 RepID=A0ABT0VKR8_9LACO|nr:EbsA family protein [Periweissella beninensis]MBM7544474.1 hypothetical protein [Periweissella beninensis]MCM2437050.1 hypothetical protein [Periweissella beninensis]MCT4395777.1 hypothetical protein [Periweissella beninensis]
MKPIRSFYQPSGLISIISWSWVVALGLLALIIQLEVTHFNIWTAGLLGIFIIVTYLSIYRRRVYLIDDTLFLGHIFYRYDSVEIKQLKNIKLSRHQLKFDVNGMTREYFITKNFKNVLEKRLVEKDIKI